MRVVLFPLGSSEEEQLRKLFIDPVFVKFLDCLKSELVFETQNINVGLVDLALNPDEHLDRRMLMKAAQLKAAIQTIEEYADSQKPHYTARIES